MVPWDMDSVNAKGGIRGEKIELVTLDDKFDPKIAAANANTLINEKNVVALFLNRGTPHTEAIMPLLEKARCGPGGTVHRRNAAAQPGEPVHLQRPVQLPARGRQGGGPSAHPGHQPHRGGARRRHLRRRCAGGRQQGLCQGEPQAGGGGQGRPQQADYPAIVPALAKATPQAILWFGSGTAVADGIKALRAAGSAAQVVTLSNNASAASSRLWVTPAEASSSPRCSL
jgi:branched-chain amino acid transport system substrate-binding protein